MILACRPRPLCLVLVRNNGWTWEWFGVGMPWSPMHQRSDADVAKAAAEAALRRALARG